MRNAVMVIKFSEKPAVFMEKTVFPKTPARLHGVVTEKSAIQNSSNVVSECTQIVQVEESGHVTRMGKMKSDNRTLVMLCRGVDTTHGFAAIASVKRPTITVVW
jgi:hypothetical protein